MDGGHSYLYFLRQQNWKQRSKENGEINRLKKEKVPQKHKVNIEFNLASPDPHKKMSDAQLEKFILFAVAVAGKTAKTIVLAIDKFLALEKGTSPFLRVRRMLAKRTLRRNLKTASLGRYDVLTRSYAELVRSGINLRMCSVEDLEKIHGIGAKTARFFILHTRPNQRLAVLDTHILKFLKEVYNKEDVPTSTPTGKKYLYWEEMFLRCADNLKMSPAQLDYEIWSRYARK